MQFERRVLYYRSPLKPLMQRILDNEIIGLRDTKANTVYGPTAVMFVWTAVLLHRVSFINETQWRLILTEAGPFLNEAGMSIGHQLDMFMRDQEHYEFASGHQLAFVDGRYTTWNSLAHRGFLDLETGEYVEQLGKPGLESLSYNLTELARREFERCQSIQLRFGT